MYYNERKINGIWYYRTTPDGEWIRLERFRVDRAGMVRDLEAMANRANHHAWSSPQLSMRGLLDHRNNCAAFAGELAERER